MSRESLKNLLAAVFLFVLATMMVDRIDGALHPRAQDVIALSIASALVVAYCRLWAKTPSVAREKRHSRDALIVGLVFSTGLVAGIIRVAAEGWDWADVFLIVPALMAWFSFKVLFRVPADAGVPRKRSESA
jgi:undecaprenyl pyrophosphate phosphatase UppP